MPVSTTTIPSGRHARAREMNSTIDEALRTLALVMGFLCSQFPAEGGVPTSIISVASRIQCEQSVNIRGGSIKAELLLRLAVRIHAQTFFISDGELISLDVPPAAEM
jgi:hypothetical protein